MSIGTAQVILAPIPYAPSDWFLLDPLRIGELLLADSSTAVRQAFGFSEDLHVSAELHHKEHRLPHLRCGGGRWSQGIVLPPSTLDGDEDGEPCEASEAHTPATHRMSETGPQDETRIHTCVRRRVRGIEGLAERLARSWLLHMLLVLTMAILVFTR
ncbi:hypothetical protein BD779DRAFT_784745 [Infundibulicybe gibba]|nr:hypothetical protein BD779DRAFT_784745 [Infundibulicybe gibba]